MGKTPDELRASVTADQYALLAAYERLYGLPDDRLVKTLAIVGASIVACWSRDKINPEDFLMKYEAQKPKPLPPEMAWQVMDSFVDQHNSRVRH